MKLKYGTWPGQHQAGGTRSGGRFDGSDCIVKYGGRPHPPKVIQFRGCHYLANGLYGAT
ncbi:hypothetical protein FOPG_18304 [Fusarium oxysporum f. sp. conglutinans race 2 54008]|uniref:Uncharacterized protein n=1 Tax=Fusarium oxysporum f. sp. conglutinans race 2 54008 TaxID=1089457 RepID=X0GPE3_FUSOX|nr:hypothetical protein FOPG_18304 [Fusarium oxysporum f. sp. conglutinans race 2 54008]